MSDVLQSATSIAIARQLAVAHPSSTLPCPVCPANLNAGNLDKHLGKVHAAEMQQASSGSGAAVLRIRGIDRRMVIPSIILLVLWGVAAFAVVILSGGHLPGLEASILGGTGLVFLGLAGAASAGMFKATLELEGDQLRLRRLFGLASTRVALPAKLESGSFTKKVLTNLTYSKTNLESEAVSVGAYLQLKGNGGSIGIGAEKAPRLGKNWAQKGWSQAKKSGRPDIEVDRAQLVALEYQLASRGQLSPKTS